MVWIPRQILLLSAHLSYILVLTSRGLSSSAQDKISQLADVLRANENATVTVQGHCDERGSEEYNLALGQRRGESVKGYLVDLGIAPSRVNVVSYGESQPVAEGHNESAWAQNRRAEFVVN